MELLQALLAVRPDRLPDAARPAQLRAMRARAREGRRDRGPRAGAARVGARARWCASAAFPISIDYNAFMRQAATAEVAERARELHRLLPNRKLILGVDRLDYTKGIPLRLKAFQNLLERYPGAARARVVHPGRGAEPRGHSRVPRPEDRDRAAGGQDQRQLRAPRRLGAGVVRLPQPVAARSARLLPRRRHRARSRRSRTA